MSPARPGAPGPLRFLRAYGILVALAAEFAYFSAASEAFLTATNQSNVLRQISLTGLVATGMTFVILTGGIDLSVGSLCAFAGVVGADLLVRGQPILTASAAALALGAFAGALQGAAIAFVRIPPFIVTLAGLTLFRGAALLYTHGRPVIGLPEEFLPLGRGFFVEGLPVPGVIALLLLAAAHLVLSRTSFGRHVYAIGGNESAALLSGIRVGTVKVAVYAIAGVSAAAAGLVLAARLGSGLPTAAELFELDAIAAVVVGGTSLSGGRGSIPRTFVGLLLIGWLTNGLNLLGVESYQQSVVLGLVIVAAVALDRLASRE